MEQLQTRILLQYVEGATIASFYNRESFDLLNIERHPDDNSQFIETDKIIAFGGRKYKVKSINFKMENKLHEIDNRYGINMHSPTDLSNFNCQIGIFVENA